jgi:hypothetical protein
MMKTDRLGEDLVRRLHDDIAALGPMPDSPTGRRTSRRLADTADHAPVFLLLLCEPLLGTAAAPATLLACARLHLYARVLDDALDDNLPLDRRNLLRIQPLFWRAVHALGAVHPDLTDAGAALLEATVAGVEADDAEVEPGAWGRKNFHLLLAPLLLSGDSASYRAALPGLEAVIALAQAHEEAAQGRLLLPGARNAAAAWLARWLSPAHVASLHEQGWEGAAVRLLADGDALLSRINRTTKSE